MAFAPEIAADVLASCKQNAGDIAAALGRTLGETIELGEATSAPYTTPPANWHGPGLVLIFKVGSSAALAVVPEASGMVPAWCTAPDATGVSKLATLAQELGMSVLPEAHMPDDFAQGRVENLAEAVGRSGLASEAAIVSLPLKSGDKAGALSLIWPVSSASAALEMPPVASPVPPAKPAGPSAKSNSPASPPAPVDFETAVNRLPTYVRSLLKIQVPVSVVLAKSRQPVSRVLNIGPGSIIQFSKNCDQPLELFVGDEPVAEGEAVKVGDKFGIRLTSMILPGERFIALRGRKAG